MARSSKLGLTTLLLTGALAPLGAQDLKEAFQLLPPTTVSIEVYANPGHLEQRANKLSAKFKAKANPFMTQLPGLKLAPSVLGTGSTLLVELPSAQPNVKRQALIIPAENFPALVKRLKAVKTAGRYTITQGKAKFTLAARGTYAVLSGDAKLVEELKGGGPNLGEELAPIVPWIKSHDTVLLAPSSTMSKGLVALRSALAPKAGSPPNALTASKFLKPVLDLAEASVTQGAMALDLPEDGSVKAHVRLFLKPGSPMLAGGAPASGPHPLAGLPGQGFVLGGGWSMSGPMRGWLEQMATLGAEMAPPGADPALTAKAVAQTRDLSLRIQAQSMSLGVPARAGDPLLGQFRTLVRVDDATAYVNGWADLLETQNQAKMLPKGMTATLKRDILPGVPSASQALTFGAMEGLPLAPGQLKLLFTALFGQPDSLVFSMARQDARTVVAVLGGAPELQAALAPVTAPLDQDPGIAASDALLPGPASFRFYVAPDGIRALVQQAMDTFMPSPSSRKLPVLPAAPPLTMALHTDSQGIELSGAAGPGTLNALVTFFHAMEALTPKKP